MRQPNTEYVLSLSYGKDSLACLGAIELLKWPLDRIVTAEVWATDTISADLPPMVKFKEKADAIIKDRWGIDVEHVSSDRTYEQCFYKKRKAGYICGWPYTQGAWCQSLLKVKALDKCHIKGAISYRGIAADEPERLARLDRVTAFSPLEAIGWTEAMCRQWCEDNDLLSPIYANSGRGGVLVLPQQASKRNAGIEKRVS